MLLVTQAPGLSDSIGRGSPFEQMPTPPVSHQHRDAWLNRPDWMDGSLGSRQRSLPWGEPPPPPMEPPPLPADFLRDGSDNSDWIGMLLGTSLDHCIGIASILGACMTSCSLLDGVLHWSRIRPKGHNCACLATTHAGISVSSCCLHTCLADHVGWSFRIPCSLLLYRRIAL